MIRKIRKQFEETRSKKHHKFDDFDSLVRRCLTQYPEVFPKHTINRDGSRVVYHFNAGELDPISLEREHGSREYLPRFYAKLAIRGIEDLISYIEHARERSTGKWGGAKSLQQEQEYDEQNAEQDDTREGS